MSAMMQGKQRFGRLLAVLAMGLLALMPVCPVFARGGGRRAWRRLVRRGA